MGHKTNAQKIYITEICLIRLILVAMIVVHHTFAPFSPGMWEQIYPENIYIGVYSHLSRICMIAVMECFSFVSGWIFGYQVLTKGELMLNPRRLLASKFKRLIVPSLVFSILYILILTPYLLQDPWLSAVLVIKGFGHLWYLPILFWCFVCLIILEKTHLNHYWMLAILFATAIFSYIHLPLDFEKTVYYMFFFYAGYMLGREKLSFKKLTSVRRVGLIGLSLIAAYIFTDRILPNLLTNLNPALTENAQDYLIPTIFWLCKIIYSSLGVLFIVCLAECVIHTLKLKLSRFWIDLSTYTFGIYIFQQFILMIIYYHTPLKHYVSPYAVPWISLIITLVLSYFLSVGMRRNKVGKLLGF